MICTKVRTLINISPLNVLIFHQDPWIYSLRNDLLIQHLQSSLGAGWLRYQIRKRAKSIHRTQTAVLKPNTKLIYILTFKSKFHYSKNHDVWTWRTLWLNLPTDSHHHTWIWSRRTKYEKHDCWQQHIDCRGFHCGLISLTSCYDHIKVKYKFPLCRITEQRFHINWHLFHPHSLSLLSQTWNSRLILYVSNCKYMFKVK